VPPPQVQRAVQTARRQLGTLFQAHVSACLAFDEAMKAVAAGRGPQLSRLDADPWDTEGRLVAEQRNLMAKQVWVVWVWRCVCVAGCGWGEDGVYVCSRQVSSR
jgi:hypothetical protein